VTCASASDCWAVGDQSSCGGCAQTLIEQWDGTSWSIVPSPNTGVADLLYGVTCASASDCWAVGSYQPGGFSPVTLIEQYTTNAVTITTSSSPSAGGTTSGGSTYVSGTSVTVSATANSHYVFTNWTENGSVVSTSSSYTFTATSNRSLVAHFTQTYTVFSSISPSSATAGGPAFTLTVNGLNFVSGSKVHWNNSTLTTTFVSGTQVTATVPSSDIRTAGTASVTVVNAPPGGGTSNAKTFTINP